MRENMEHVLAQFVEPLTSGWTILKSTSTRSSGLTEVTSMDHDTIFAIDSGAGRAAIAVLRLSGPAGLTSRLVTGNLRRSWTFPPPRLIVAS
jgi:hypothetical protein